MCTKPCACLLLKTSGESFFVCGCFECKESAKVLAGKESPEIAERLMTPAAQHGRGGKII